MLLVVWLTKEANIGEAASSSPELSEGLGCWLVGLGAAVGTLGGGSLGGVPRSGPPGT